MLCVNCDVVFIDYEFVFRDVVVYVGVCEFMHIHGVKYLAHVKFYNECAYW